MVEFSYVIKDELGIHARPAGLLAKTAAGFMHLRHPKSNQTIYL